MISDALWRKRLMERMVTYQTTLPESQRWKPLCSFAEKQLKNKIDRHLFKKGKAEIKRHIVPLLSGQRSAEKTGQAVDELYVFPFRRCGVVSWRTCWILRIIRIIDGCWALPTVAIWEVLHTFSTTRYV